MEVCILITNNNKTLIVNDININQPHLFWVAAGAW